jgi:hypothetical protein
VIGARYDTMDPAHMQMMAGRLPAGCYLDGMRKRRLIDLVRMSVR